MIGACREETATARMEEGLPPRGCMPVSIKQECKVIARPLETPKSAFQRCLLSPRPTL